MAQMTITLEDLEKEMDGLILKAGSEIDQSVLELGNGMNSKMARSGRSCVESVRNQRKNALNKYQEIKNTLNTHFLSLIKTMEELDGIRQRREKIRELYDAKDKLESEQKRKTQILDDKKSLTSFQKFERYSGAASPRLDDDSLSDSYKSVTEAIQRERVEFQRNSTRSLLTGIVVTLAFAMTDFYLLNSVFIASNMSARAALTIAFLTAIALDAPPFFLGLVMSRRTDLVRIWNLRDDADDPGMRLEIGKFSWVSFILLVSIVIVFLAYFAVRSLLFLGGGDINIIIHSIMESGFKITPSSLAHVEYNGGDIISTFVPLVTSVSAFAIGILRSTSEADYINRAIAVVDKELDNCVFRCDSKIIEYNSEMNVLQEEIAELKSQLYAYYVGDQKDAPKEDDAMIGDIRRAAKRLDFMSYEPIYGRISNRIRLFAVRKLSEINQTIASYTEIANVILSMPLSPDETDILDEIWVVGKGDQKPETAETVKKIKELERLMLP